MELSFTDYIKYTQNALREEIIEDIARKVKTLGQFKKNSQGMWEPAYYAGYTFITPTYGDDAANRGSLNQIIRIKQELSGIVNPLKTVAAPDEALHMTLARLISGDAFQKSMIKTKEKEFFEAFLHVFAQTDMPEALEFEIRGLTIFPQGVIAAVVAPVGEDDYQCLQLLRDKIYSDYDLMCFGVERKRGFLGHISLFYIEEDLSDDEKDILKETIIEANRKFFLKPLTYLIANAEVRKFENFLRFYREDNWPVYRFR